MTISNFDKQSTNFDPSEINQMMNYYNSLPNMKKNDVLEILKILGHSFEGRNRTTRNSPVRSNRNNTPQVGMGVFSTPSATPQISEDDKKKMHGYLHQDTKTNIDKTTTSNNVVENGVAKYALENTPKVIKKLVDESKNLFILVTNMGHLKIKIDVSNIPHALALSKVREIIETSTDESTRIYIEAKDRLNKRKDKKKYIKIIIDIFKNLTLKAKIIHTYKNEDDYNKNNLVKMGFKVCNFEYIIEGIQQKGVKNITIFRENKKKADAYLLTLPIKSDNSETYCCLVIVKDKYSVNQNNDHNYDNIYVIESGGIITNDEYIHLITDKKFAKNWKQTKIKAKNYLFKSEMKDIEIAGEMQKERIKNLTVYGNNLDAQAHYSFSGMVQNNDLIIRNEIYKLLHTNKPELIESRLPILLIKLYQSSYLEEDLDKEDYYKILLLLNTISINNNDLKNLINACYKNDVDEIKNAISGINFEESNPEKNATITISKDDGLYNLVLKINLVNDYINEHKYINGNLIENIPEIFSILKEIYIKLLHAPIITLEDAKKYILALSEFKHIYIEIMVFLANFYSNILGKNGTNINMLYDIAKKYPNTFTEFTEIAVKTGNDNNYTIDSEIKNIERILNSDMLKKANELLIKEDIQSNEDVFNILNDFENDQLENITLYVKLRLIKSFLSQLTNQTEGAEIELSKIEEKINFINNFENDFIDRNSNISSFNPINHNIA